MEQFDTLPIQYRHMEHMHEGVWLKKNDKMTAMRTLTIFPLYGFCIQVILQKVRNSCFTPNYLYIFILVQISCVWKFASIKVFNYLTFTNVTGILNTGVHISL